MFPQRTKFLRRPIGWQDLWESIYYGDIKDGKESLLDEHDACHTVIHIGKENGELFKFCPRCEVKLK